MFEKIICAISWIVWVLLLLAWFDVKADNRELRAALNEPVNCEAICEVMFEELGC